MYLDGCQCRVGVPRYYSRVRSECGTAPRGGWNHGGIRSPTTRVSVTLRPQDFEQPTDILAQKKLLYAISASPVHDWPGHAENAERVPAILEALDRFGLGSVQHSLVRELIGFEPALPEDIIVVHDPRYIALLEEKAGAATDVAGLMIDSDTYLTRSTYTDCLKSAGAVKSLIDSLFECTTEHGSTPAAFALCRPPGHHAVLNKPMGFCLLNNAAIAATYAKKQYGLKKIAIFDFDVHHGNGTQDAFYNDPSVLFVSMHQDGSYPGTGRAAEVGMGDALGTTINVNLPPGSGHMAALGAFEDVVAPAITRFEPELIIISAGYDAHFLDPLASLQYKNETFHHLTRGIMDLANTLCHGRALFVLEGGYDLKALAESVANSFSAILDEEAWDPVDGTLFDEPTAKVQAAIADVRSIHSL